MGWIKNYKEVIKIFKLVIGDLLEQHHDLEIICQQVNCQGKMGAGLGGAIRKKYPKVYRCYLVLCNECRYNKKDLLGITLTVQIHKDLYISNMFGQEYYGRNPNKVYTSYEAFRRCCKNLKNQITTVIEERNKIREQDINISFPYKIGCGLANGDFKKILRIIKEELGEFNIKFYTLEEPVDLEEYQEYFE